MPVFGRKRRPLGGSPNAVRLDDDSLTAAGYRITRAKAEQQRRLIQPWQEQSLSYYDQLGEINFAAQFYARMLAPLRLYVAELNDDGDWVESENPDPKAKAALDRVQDPGGGTAGLLGAYGRLMFLTGDALLFVSLDPDTQMEQWEMLSTDELRVQGGQYIRYRAPSLMAEDYHEPDDDDWAPVDDRTAIAFRFWQRHPRQSALADATMRGVLDVCEELLILTRVVRARGRSRLAGSGILAISEDFSWAPLEPVPDEDLNNDPFVRDLTTAMMQPIAKEGTPSAVVPLVVRGPTAAVKDGIRHIQVVDPTQLYPETGLRNECINRLAIGIDMPPEVLRGYGDTNHWNAWLLDEQTWKNHGMPKADQFVTDLTSSYFRPQLRKDGVADWQRWKIDYDPSEVVNHPDRTKDAKDLYDRRVIGKEAVRRVSGFAEDDAPTNDELAEMVGVATRDSSLAWYGTPAPRGGAVETAPGVVEQAIPNDGQAGTPTGGDVEPGPPNEGQPKAPAEGVVGSAAIDPIRLGRVLGAADLALHRAREAAGSRLRSLARRDDELVASIDGVGNREVAARLGAENVRKLCVTERELVAAASPLIADAVRLWGLDGKDSALICEQIERHAVRTLYDANPTPLPPQFEGFVAGLLRG